MTEQNAPKRSPGEWKARSSLSVLLGITLLTFGTLPNSFAAEFSHQESPESGFPSRNLIQEHEVAIPEHKVVISEHDDLILKPTKFESIDVSESPERPAEMLQSVQRLLEDGSLEAAFLTLRGLLFLHADEYLEFENRTQKENLTQNTFENNLLYFKKLILNNSLPSSSPYRPIASECTAILDQLSPEQLAQWRISVDQTVQTALLSTESLSPEALRDLQIQNPRSSFEQEIWERLALHALESGNVPLALACSHAELESIAKNCAQKSIHFQNLPTQSELESRIKALKSLSASVPSPTAITSQWTVTMTQILNPGGESIFEDFLPEEQRGSLFPNRNRDKIQEQKAVPQFRTFTSDGRLLVARIGTRVSVWPAQEEETRPHPYLVLLDLSREGQLLWITSQESPSSALIGNPLADGRYVYIPELQTGSRSMIFLNVYSLADGSLHARYFLFSAQTPPDYSSVFLPVRWTNERQILIGGPSSGIQIQWQPGF